MPHFDDLSGKRFGRWVVLRRTEDHISKSGYHFTQYECLCDCGTTRCVLASTLKNGRSQSCGCYAKEVYSRVCRDNFKTHGETKTRLYQIYAGMKKRCYNKAAYNYADYGARGISICEGWLNSWEAFRDWSLTNGYDDDLSIDRIDVNGDYSPDNCRWVTRDVQANNRRSNKFIAYNGVSHTIAEWSRILGIPYNKLHKKLRSGHPLSEIIESL